MNLHGVLSAMSADPSHPRDIAARCSMGVEPTLAALRELRSRGLVVAWHNGYSVSAGLTLSQANVLYWIGERGAASASDLAAKLSRPVDADLRALEAMGRIECIAGQWQLRGMLSSDLAYAITRVLERRAALPFEGM